MIKANFKTNSNKDIPREKSKSNQHLLDNDLESSKPLIAKIEQERDYFHTCIYSQY